MERSKKYKKDSSNLNKEEKEKIFLKKSKEIDDANIGLLNTIEDHLIKEIIKTFLENNYLGFTKSIFSYAKKRKEFFLGDIESSWYMHKRLSEEEEFRKIYYSYKEKNNFEPAQIKVGLPE